MSLYGLQWTVSVAWDEGGLAGLLVGWFGRPACGVVWQACLWGGLAGMLRVREAVVWRACASRLDRAG